MRLRQPRSPRTATLFPDTTLFRADDAGQLARTVELTLLDAVLGQVRNPILLSAARAIERARKHSGSFREFAMRQHGIPEHERRVVRAVLLVRFDHPPKGDGGRLKDLDRKSVV